MLNYSSNIYKNDNLENDTHAEEVVSINKNYCENLFFIFPNLMFV
jgi:hypothetical protein